MRHDLGDYILLGEKTGVEHLFPRGGVLETVLTDAYRASLQTKVKGVPCRFEEHAGAHR